MKKREREEKTDYRQRKRLLSSKKKRVVIRKSNQYIRIQVIEHKPEGDETLVDIKSFRLKDYEWKGSFTNLPACYLTGFLAGKKAKAQGIEECIADLGMKKPTPGSRIYACLEGFIDASVSVPHSKKVFPSKERIQGEHIEEYGKKLEEGAGRPENFFIKENPLKVPELFEKVKTKIEGE